MLCKFIKAIQTKKSMKNRNPSTFTNLVFLSIFLAFLFLTKSQARDSQPYYCTSSCGDIKEISYPFRLRGQPLNCGDPDYELSCENNTAILDFKAGKYLVKSIHYEKRLIRIVDVNLANEICSLPSQPFLTIDFDIRYRGLVANTETKFLKCSKPVNDSSYMRIPCLSGNSSTLYAVYGSYTELDPSCSDPISVVLSVYDAKSPSSYEDLRKLLNSGFDLGWSVECRDCVLSGRECDFYNDTEVGKPYYKCHKPYNDGNEPVKVILILVGIIIAGLLVVGLVVFLLYKFISKRKARNEINKLLDKEQASKRCTYNDIISLTSHLEAKIGEGSFGSVYKGKLPNGDFVAVKMLEKFKINDKDFINQIVRISSTNHDNVMKLAGFCCDSSQKALIYEYMPNGSLEEHLLSRGRAESLNWDQFQQIAIGTAKGIEHLHTQSDESSVHLDIKPSNILLDQNWIPKVSDFGLVKFYPKKYDFVKFSTARGSSKYIAPELMSGNFMAASSKSDVYSFGMLLLEMFRQKKNLDLRSSDSYSVSWIYEHLSEGRDLRLGDVTEAEARITRKLCIVGLWCLQVNPSERPSMSKVVEMLENGTDNLPNASSQLS